MSIRKARAGDAAAFLRIKAQLPMPEGLATTTGGFLLGTDEATYDHYIREVHCLIAEQEGAPCGFGIVFPDEMVKASDIWQRRRSAQWLLDIEAYEHVSLAYFEQLAFLHGTRRTALAAAFHLTKIAFEGGAEAIFTTTVQSPILNLAALPFIKAAGGVKAGNIAEDYPGIGPIRSDIYLLRREVFEREVPKRAFYDYLCSTSVSAA